MRRKSHGKPPNDRIVGARDLEEVCHVNPVSQTTQTPRALSSQDRI